MFKQIFRHLRFEGFDVYHIGQHQGHCKEPYVVIKEDGRSNFLTGLAYDLVDIIMFYPLGHYSEFEGYINEAAQALKHLKPLKPTGDRTPIMIDDGVRAYTASMRYQIFRRRDV